MPLIEVRCQRTNSMHYINTFMTHIPAHRRTTGLEFSGTTLLIVIGPAPRSTHAQMVAAEAHQTQVIAILRDHGEHDLANRLERCQEARQHRDAGWPAYRCGTAGCLACRRRLIRTWWRGFIRWCEGTPTSIAMIPLDDDRLTAIRKLRKGLRDIRDRHAREDWRSSGVAYAGFLSGDEAMVLVQHPGLRRAHVGAALGRRWPGMVVGEVGEVVPGWKMPVEDVVRLAQARRGVEPIRVMVMPRFDATVQQTVAGSGSGWETAMPMAF